jgi:lysophospholipase L1-like esterase
MHVHQILSLAILTSICFSIPHNAPVVRRSPFDVKTLAILGDSFSSGPGAGMIIGDSTESVQCKRYDHAYGPLVAAASEIQGPKPVDSQFIACSGARMQNLYVATGSTNQPQIPQAPRLKEIQPDMVTLSIGGNDAGFITVLDKGGSTNGFEMNLTV